VMHTWKSYLNTDDRIHVESRQLPGLYDGDAHLKVLGLQPRTQAARRLGPAPTNNT
jgi:hypothetical protein